MLDIAQRRQRLLVRIDQYQLRVAAIWPAHFHDDDDLPAPEPEHLGSPADSGLDTNSEEEENLSPNETSGVYAEQVILTFLSSMAPPTGYSQQYLSAAHVEKELRIGQANDTLQAI